MAAENKKGNKFKIGDPTLQLSALLQSQTKYNIGEKGYIFILDESSQDSVLISLKNFYNMIDFEFWLVVADRPVDISVYMSQMQLLLNNTQVSSIRKLILQDIEKGQTFINNSIVDTEYYIMFKETNDDMIAKKMRLLINGLATCGLNAVLVSNDDLRVVLDNFLNGGKTTEFGTVMPV